MILTATYGDLHPDFSQVPICLRNLSVHSIEVPTKTIIGKVALAKQVLPVVLLTETLGESMHGPQRGWILEELSPQDLEEWPEQEQARELLLKWEQLFACSDLNLHKMSLIKLPDQINRPDALQGTLPAYSLTHVWKCKDPPPGDVRYWCHPEVTQSKS